MSAIPRQDRDDYTCEDCDEALVYANEQVVTARDEIRSKYRCPNPDCETNEVLLT
jgi:transposase